MKRYYYCDGLTMMGIDVTFEPLGNCILVDDWSFGNEYNRVYQQSVTVSIPFKISSDLKIFLIQTIEEWSDWHGTSVYDEQYTITIPAGQVSATVTKMCRVESSSDFGAGGVIFETQEVINVVMIDQPELPTGCDPDIPVPCDLTISTIIKTNPTRRGVNDGSITVNIEGATGSTPNVHYIINNVIHTTTGSLSSYTFSNLGGGVYNVVVKQALCQAVNENIVLLDGEFRTGDFRFSTPANLSAVGNPIVCNVQTHTNNVNSSKAKMRFRINDLVYKDGYHVVFAFTSPMIYNQTFTAKAFPNRSNYFLATETKDMLGNTQVTNTFDEIAQSFAEVLDKDVFISNLYNIDITNYSTYSDVILTAKDSGKKYNLNNTNVFIRNENNHNVVTGITRIVDNVGRDRYDGSLIPDYYLYAEIYTSTSNIAQYPTTGASSTYFKIAEMTLPFSSDNNHMFIINEILKPYVSTSKPFYDFTGYTTQPYFLRPFYLKLGEKYPIISNSNTIKKRYKTQTPVKWAINSALDYYNQNTMNEYIGVERKFLTNSPNPKHIQRKQNEYLYFILDSNHILPTALFGDIYFYDGTIIQNVNFFNIIYNVGGFEINRTSGVLMLNLSYDKLKLRDYEYVTGNTKKIKYLDVVVKYDDGNWKNYTEMKRYMFNINEQTRKFGVIFQNKLGGYDTFDFVGIKEITLDRTFDTYTINTMPSPHGAYPQGFKNNVNYNTKIVKRIVANTGYINKDHMQWLIELLTSDNVYDYTEENQHYLKVIGHQYIMSSQEDIFDLEITFEQTIYENRI